MPIHPCKESKLSGVKTNGTRLKPIAPRIPTTRQLRKHENKPLKLTIHRKSEAQPNAAAQDLTMSKKPLFDLNLDESDPEDWPSSTNPIVLSQNEPVGFSGFFKDDKRLRSRSASVNSASSEASKRPGSKEDPVQLVTKEETVISAEKKVKLISKSPGKATRAAGGCSSNITSSVNDLPHSKKKKLDRTQKSNIKAAPLVINIDSEVEEVENSEPIIAKSLEDVKGNSKSMNGNRGVATEQKRTTHAREIVEEDELGATAQKDVDFPFELSSSQRSRRGQKTFGGKLQKRDLDRRKKEKDQIEQIMQSSQPDDSDFVDYEKKFGVLKKVDNIAQKRKKENEQRLEEWRDEIQRKDFIDGREMMNVAQAIKIDLPDDLLAEIASSQAQDCDSSPGNSRLKRKREGNSHDIDLTMFDFPSDLSQNEHKCPICQHPVSPNLYNSYGTKALQKYRNQQKLHTSHEKEWAFTQKAKLCIPDVNWSVFEQRCQSHFDFLTRLMKGNADVTSHYRQEYAKLHARKHGKDKTKNEFAGGNWDQTMPGYYGPYGSMKMSDLIMQSSLIKQTFTGKIDKCPISAGEYSVSVLVPELGVQLIMEDMNISDYDKGLRFMIDTIKIGQILNSIGTHEDDHDDNDDDNHHLSDDDDHDGKEKKDSFSLPDDDNDGEIDWRRPIEIDDDNDAEIPDDFECDEWIHGVDETILVEDGDDHGVESQYVG